ncbi:YjcZ family sporulation protein, partial [Priestia megaterium]
LFILLVIVGCSCYY